MGDNKVAMPIITHHMRSAFSVMSIYEDYDNTPSHIKLQFSLIPNLWIYDNFVVHKILPIDGDMLMTCHYTVTVITLVLLSV